MCIYILYILYSTKKIKNYVFVEHLSFFAETNRQTCLIWKHLIMTLHVRTMIALWKCTKWNIQEAWVLLYMRVCVCACVYVYMCVCLYLCLCAYKCVCVCAYECTHTHTHKCTRAHTRTNKKSKLFYVYYTKMLVLNNLFTYSKYILSTS